MKVLIIFCIAVFAYLAGSVPFGLLLVRRFKSVDLRQTGSGNIGATNALRTGGWPIGTATLLLDGLKGAVPVYMAGLSISPETGCLQELALSLTAVSAFCGHLYPVYFRFRTGGKGVATAAGCFAVISPLSLLAGAAVFLLAAVLSRRVSVGSLAAALMLPAAVLVFEDSYILGACAVILAVMVAVRHKDNIRRLFEGKEPGIRRR